MMRMERVGRRTAFIMAAMLTLALLMWIFG